MAPYCSSVSCTTDSRPNLPALPHPNPISPPGPPQPLDLLVPHLPTDGVTYYVYIVASRSRVLYTGVTNDLERRVFEHKNKLTPGFTAKYNVDRLVYFEDTGDVLAAIAREKQLKRWLRARKVALIEATNPKWLDLSRGWS